MVGEFQNRTEHVEPVEEVEADASSHADSLQEPEKSHSKLDPSDGSREDGGYDVEKAPTEHNMSRSVSRDPATRVVTAQDWTGPDDPENPFNWPMSKRVYQIVESSLFGFTVTFGSSVYTPGNEEVAAHFSVSSEAATLGLSLWTLGLAFGPLLAAPISETMGRRVIYRFSLPISLLLTMGAGFSKSFGTLLALRFLGGLTGSPTLAVGAGTNADCFPPRWRAYATSAFLVAPFLGPAVGPVVGGFVAQYKGWRWTQWTILFLGTAVWISALGISETHKSSILKARSKRLGIEPPKKGPQGLAAIKFLLVVTLLRPVRMLFTEPVVAFFSLYTAFTFGLLFAFFGAFPLVFTRVYHFNIYQNGLVFIGVGLGVLLGWLCAVIFDRLIYQKEYKKAIAAGKENVAPEHRLYGAMAGSLGIPIGLFWFAWTARHGVHWIVPILATIPFAWGNMSIFTSSALFLVDVYGPLNGASAMAANGLLRYLLGAAFPLFIVQMYNTMGIPWATSLLAFLSLLMLPIPWVFFRYGPRFRARSAYDTIKA